MEAQKWSGRRWLVGLIVVVVLTLVAWFALARMHGKVQVAGAGTVPKAECGPNDRTESVQGQTTMAERFAPGPSNAYNCNLELVGQYAGEGSAFGMEAYGDVVYMTTWPHADNPNPGVTVLDVSDSSAPKVTAYLDSKGMLHANESLTVNPARKLLMGAAMPTPTFDLYDISTPLTPKLLSSTEIPTMMSHLGEFTPDGMVYLSAIIKANPKDGPQSPSTGLIAIDTSDPAHLKPLNTWLPENKDWQTHALRLSPDGKRAYVAMLQVMDDQPGKKSPNPNGLAIFDTSDFVTGKPNPQFRLISTLYWDDTHFSQDATPIMIGGKPFIAFTDVSAAIGWEKTPPVANACASGKPGRGFARLIDISDEKNPKTASKLMMEVATPANCERTRLDPVIGYGYGAQACVADNPLDAKMLACGHGESGLRVFDIRDPSHPRELAYYKPPATRTAPRRAAPNLEFLSHAKDHTADQVIIPRFRKSGREIWFNSFDNGFQVVRFSDAFIAAHKDLFPGQ
ncbi:MAG: LVIVD repeat-containing protein [Sphingomonadaceae bacterium]